MNRAPDDPALRPRVRDAAFIHGDRTRPDAAALLKRDAERYTR